MHEAAVVVVAGDRPAVQAVERRAHRVQRERLPAAAGRGVVAAVEHRGRPGGVGDRPGDRVHADVVVPVGHERDDGVALLRLAQVEVRRRRPRRRRRTPCSCRRCRPRSRRAGGSGAVVTSPRTSTPSSSSGIGTSGPRNSCERHPLAVRRRPPSPARATAARARCRTGRRARAPTDAPCGRPNPADQLAAPGRADQQPDQQRHQAEHRTAERRVDRIAWTAWPTLATWPSGWPAM